METRATSREIGLALLKGLGLPTEGVTRVTLDCRAGGAASVTVERVVPVGALDAPLSCVSEYEVRPKAPADVVEFNSLAADAPIKVPLASDTSLLAEVRADVAAIRAALEDFNRLTVLVSRPL